VFFADFRFLMEGNPEMNVEARSKNIPAVLPSLLMLLTFSLLFCSYRWNIFHIESARRTSNLSLADPGVTATMHIYADGPALQRDFGEIETFDNGKHSPYIMQVGLQRLFFSWVSPASQAGVDHAIPYLRSLIVAVLAFVFTVFVYIVRAEFGYVSAGATAVLLAFSNWLIIFAPDLFWVCATFFVPFVLSWFLGDPAAPKYRHRVLAVLYVFFCTIKCLCGFDYITNIFAGVAVPFVYYGLRRGDSPMRILLRAGRYGVLSVAAFFTAILFQLMQYALIEKDLNGCLVRFVREAQRRTTTNGEGISNGYDNAVLSLLHRLHFSAAKDAMIRGYLPPFRPVLRYFRYLGMGAATVPLPIHSIGLPIGLFVVGFVAAVWLKRHALWSSLSDGTVDRTKAWTWATFAALGISHIWILAANGHMTHTFFNAIVFYIPFLPMAYVLVGVALTSVVRNGLNLTLRRLHSNNLTER
jgi:hypothetical protein